MLRRWALGWYRFTRSTGVFPGVLPEWWVALWEAVQRQDPLVLLALLEGGWWTGEVRECPDLTRLRAVVAWRAEAVLSTTPVPLGAVGLWVAAVRATRPERVPPAVAAVPWRLWTLWSEAAIAAASGQWVRAVHLWQRSLGRPLPPVPPETARAALQARTTPVWAGLPGELGEAVRAVAEGMTRALWPGSPAVVARAVVRLCALRRETVQWTVSRADRTGWSVPAESAGRVRVLPL